MMNIVHKCRAFFLLPAITAAAGCITVVPHEETERCPIPGTPSILSVWSSEEFPAGMSGITPFRTGGESGAAGSYLAVSDRGGVIREVLVSVSGDASAPLVTYSFGRTFRIKKRDNEGIAYAAGTLYVQDESSAEIGMWRFSSAGPASVEPFATVKPELPGRIAWNSGMEGLAVSPDGLTLWGAFEAPISCDPPDCLRIIKFSRPSLSHAWSQTGQYFIKADSLHGKEYEKLPVNGISAICILPGGELVAVERATLRRLFLPAVRVRIYKLLPEYGSPIANSPIDLGKHRPVNKELICEIPGMLNFEGICPGPVLPDGRQTLLLIADAAGPLPGGIMCLALPDAVGSSAAHMSQSGVGETNP